MTVTRLSLINPSLRTNHLTWSLSTFSRQHCSARPEFSGTSNIGARNYHGTKRPAHRQWDFHNSSTNEAAKEEPPDYYKFMGLTRNATTEQIKHSYYKLAKELHPEAPNQRVKTSHPEWDRVAQAYRTLSKLQSRREYDRIYNSSKAAPSVSSTWGWRSSPAEPEPAAEKPFNPKEWFEQLDRQQKEAAAGGAIQVRQPFIQTVQLNQTSRPRYPP